MKIYIDQFFSVISSWLKKWETICSDIESLEQAIILRMRMLSPPKEDHQSFWGWMLQISLTWQFFPSKNSLKNLHITLFPTNFISSLSLALGTFYVITRCGHTQTPVVLMNNQKQLSQKKKCMHVQGVAKPKLKKQKLNLMHIRQNRDAGHQPQLHCALKM